MPRKRKTKRSSLGLPITRKTAQGYLYAKVDEYTTVTDIKGQAFKSYREMEQAFRDWLWGTQGTEP